MIFNLSPRSYKHLYGVDNRLVRLVERAITLTKVDFAVISGLRTKEEQARLVARGASKTTESMHCYGLAVDLAPVVGNRVSWDWNFYYPMAEAVLQASRDLKIPVRWGGVWDRRGAQLDLSDLRGEVAGYVSRRKRIGKTAFIDGPHFELVDYD